MKWLWLSWAQNSNNEEREVLSSLMVGMSQSHIE